MPTPVRPAGAPAPEVTSAIRHASARTGVDFSYLMAQASQESGFRPTARASTSSATGLYQFTDRTWLQMVRDHGAKYGLGELAGQIGRGERFKVGSDAARQEILALRDDPALSAAMAAEYAQANGAKLRQELGREPLAGDLYLAHFLGPSGAVKFLTALEQSPDASAASVLPAAAEANKSVFYARDDGRALSVAEIHGRISDKIAAKVAAFAPSSTTQVAEASMPSPAFDKLPAVGDSRPTSNTQTWRSLAATTLPEKTPAPELSAALDQILSDAPDAASSGRAPGAISTRAALKAMLSAKPLAPTTLAALVALHDSSINSLFAPDPARAAKRSDDTAPNGKRPSFARDL